MTLESKWLTLLLVANGPLMVPSRLIEEDANRYAVVMEEDPKGCGVRLRAEEISTDVYEKINQAQAAGASPEVLYQMLYERR